MDLFDTVTAYYVELLAIYKIGWLQMSSVLVGGTDVAANAAQAASLSSNSKYRAYVAAVDKALKAFEATNEWADLISALAKLSRVRLFFFH